MVDGALAALPAGGELRGAGIGSAGPVDLVAGTVSPKNLPVLAGTSREGVAKGGYVLADAGSGAPEVVIIATGSELQLAVEARGRLEGQGVGTRVVSMPCREWFDEQEASYRETVIPPTVKARVSVEAGIKLGWREIVGDHGRSVSIETFGASADYERLYTEYGITARAVADAAHDSITAAG